MNVKWFAKLVLEEFGFLLLLEKLLFKQIDLALQIRDALSFFLRVNEFSLVGFDKVNEFDDVVNLLLVVDFALFEGRLLNFNLLVEQM